MSSDVRIVKFQMMIWDIWKNLSESFLVRPSKEFMSVEMLALIYDYDRLNDYGKVIMRQVCQVDDDLNLYDPDGFDPDYYNFLTEKVAFAEKIKDTTYRIKEIRETVSGFNNDNRYAQKILFLFWTLMILAVDDTDKEEHLSLICDFAKLLHINDTEMMDVVQIIRLIFGKETEGFLASIKVKDCFKRLLKDFRFQDKPPASL